MSAVMVLGNQHAISTGAVATGALPTPQSISTGAVVTGVLPTPQSISTGAVMTGTLPTPQSISTGAVMTGTLPTPQAISTGAVLTGALHAPSATTLLGTQHSMPVQALPTVQAPSPTMVLGTQHSMPTVQALPTVQAPSASMVLGTQRAMPTGAMQPPPTMYVQVPAAVALGTQAAALTTQSPRSMVMSSQESAKFCARCGGVITGQYGTAGGAFYHPECMTCDRCGVQLLGAFSMQGGEKICPNCSPLSICTKCGQMITGQVLTTGDGMKFHPECFTCDMCNKPLPSQFHKRNGMRLCDNCVPQEEVLNACAACGQPITGREVSTGNGLYYHPECLTCESCGCVLSGSFSMRNGRRICDNCNVVQKVCTKCGQPVLGPAVTTKDGSHFHPECLTCDGCQTQLTGPFHLHEGRRFCDACAPKPPEAKVCVRCGLPIMGQYASIGDGVHLHAECFTCAACNKPLSGIRIFRSADTGFAFCSEECHDEGPRESLSMVKIQTGKIGVGSMVPVQSTNSMVAPRFSAAHEASILEPVPDDPVTPRKSHKDKKDKNRKTPPKVEHKKKGMCCA